MILDKKPDITEIRRIKKDIRLRKNVKKGERYLVKVRDNLTVKEKQIPPNFTSEMDKLAGKYIIIRIIIKSTGFKAVSLDYEFSLSWLEDWKFLG